MLPNLSCFSKIQTVMESSLNILLFLNCNHLDAFGVYVDHPKYSSLMEEITGALEQHPPKASVVSNMNFGHGTISGWLLINVSTIISAANFFRDLVRTYPVGGKGSCRDQVSKCHYPPNPVKLFTVGSMKALLEHLP